MNFKRGNMKFYVASYRIGNEPEKFQSLIPGNKKTAFIMTSTFVEMTIAGCSHNGTKALNTKNMEG